MALWIILSTTFLPKVGHSQTYRFISSLFLYTSQMGAINHFSTICVYLIFISIYKPYGLHKSFQHNIFAKGWRSKTYRFILSLFLYTSRMGAINHFSTICLPRYGTLKLTGLFYSCLHKTWSIQAMTALWIIFKYNMLAKCMALSNLQVYFIFISIFKPWCTIFSNLPAYFIAFKLTGLMVRIVNHFKYNMLANVWRSQTYRFIYLHFYIQAIWAL